MFHVGEHGQSALPGSSLLTGPGDRRAHPHPAKGLQALVKGNVSRGSAPERVLSLLGWGLASSPGPGSGSGHRMARVAGPHSRQCGSDQPAGALACEGPAAGVGAREGLQASPLVAVAW